MTSKYNCNVCFVLKFGMSKKAKLKKSFKLPLSKPNTQINRQTKNLINLRNENFANKQVFSVSK